MALPIYDDGYGKNVGRLTEQGVKYGSSVKPKQAAVDKGFRGVLYHPLGVEVLVCSTASWTHRSNAGSNATVPLNP
ncbi:MAG: hypothetical protein IGS48_17715 [Oscillatoriales cyanobacterium C42_A2020_001]|nr:hypothetical protein [Leptolyngbyaceae cyanobacterium C42_A2020_001]